MGGLAEHAVTSSLDAVRRRDTALAKAVIERDARIDEMQRELEKKVIRLLALRQPLAHDLRQAIAALKISSNLERIGDLAKNIAKRTLVLNESEPIELTRGVDRLGRLVIGRLKDVLDAYARGEPELAISVWYRDDDVDQHYNSLFRELLTYMMEDPRMIGSGAHLLFVAKNLERIGDHATNIAEVVHYVVTGEDLPRERPKRDATLNGRVAGDDTA
jgi:phosphate transport system protein